MSTPPPNVRFRRFARVVTREVGALDTSFLGRGRPLGTVRVLNAVGHGATDLQTVRDSLGLDSGLMSRILRGLETEGLIETAPHPEDARRRSLRLTDKGAAEFEEYERISNEMAERALARHPDTEALLAAADLLASALGRGHIRIERADPKAPEALLCLQAYYDELAQRFPGGFDVQLSRDPDAHDMVPPRGSFFVAMSDGLPIGCVALKGGGGSIAEIKRLWVAPSARRLGLSKRLMSKAEAAARDLGIGTLRLDTNSALPEAERLYRTTGWTEVSRFNDDPYPDLFFEKRLSP